MIKKTFLLVATGGCGGIFAFFINFPLPFFLGPFFSVMILSFLGFKFEIPETVWSGTRFVTGVYLASKLSPALVDDVIRWSGSFFMQFILIAVTVLTLSIYYRKYCGFDLPTSISSSTPGGATTVFLIAKDFGNINVQQHFIIHLSRIFFIVSIIPFTVQFYLGSPISSTEQISNFDSAEGLLIVFVSIVSSLTAKRLALPSPFFIGPLIGSGVLYVSGLVQIGLPDYGLNGCLFIIGTYIGLRFQDYALKDFFSSLRFSFFGILLTFALTISFSLLSYLIFDLDLLALFLSYTPGGIYEMTGIAMALDYEADFVVAHHLIRLFTVIIFMPFIFRFVFK